jgi:hypothetical protein
VEAIPDRIVAYSNAEWHAAWNYAPRIPRIARQIGPPSRHSNREALMRAAYFVAGRLQGEGFSLFQNGGQPLLQRRRQEWVEEILFHAPPTGVSGFYSPVSVELLLSLQSLPAIRQKYSRSVTLVPAFVAKANLGELDEPRCRILWNVERHECIEEIAERVYRAGLDWIDDLSDPILLEDKVLAHSLPLVDDVTGLEMLLAMCGRHAASRTVRAWQRDPETGPMLERRLEELGKSFGPVYRGEDPGQNLAVIAVTYDLLPKNRRR